MAEIPKSTINIQDPGFSISQPASLTPLVLGSASAGADGLSFHQTPASIVNTHDYGPLVDEGCFIAKQGGSPIGLLKGAASVAGDLSAITKVAAHAGPTITVAGTPVFDAFVRLQITKAGDLGAGKFRFSLDGFDGDTDAQRSWSGEYVIPSGGTFAIPNLGPTLTFPAGTYLLNSEYTFVAECAALNASDVSTAFAALQASKRRWRFMLAAFSANNGDAAAHATLAATLQSELDNLAANYGKYRRAMMQAESAQAPSDAAAVETAFTSVIAPRLLVAYGQARRLAGRPMLGFAAPRRNVVSFFAARAATELLSTDLKRVLSGPVEGLLELFDDEFQNSTGLDDIHISTMRTWPSDEQTGAFIGQGRLKGGPSSNFDLWPRGTVMDVACEIVHEEQIKFIGRGLRTQTSGEHIGALDPRDIPRLEKDVKARLNSELLDQVNAEGTFGHVTDLRYRIDGEWNVAQTETIVGDLEVVGLSYASQVMATVGFTLSLE